MWAQHRSLKVVAWFLELGSGNVTYFQAPSAQDQPEMTWDRAWAKVSAATAEK